MKKRWKMKKAKEKDPIENPSLRKTISLFADIFQTLKPPPKLTIDTWADTYRILKHQQNQEDGKLTEYHFNGK